jgi:hypothetical protein
MPKTHNTLKQQAVELLRMVERGPSFSDPTMFGRKWTDDGETPADQYKRWSDSYIVPKLLRLVPQLKSKQPNDGAMPRRQTEK